MSCCKALEVDEEVATLIISAKKVNIQHLLTEKIEMTEKTVQAASCYGIPLQEGYIITLPNNSTSGWVEFDDGMDVDGSKTIVFLHLATLYYWTDLKLKSTGSS
jgi:hypothetical protein